MLNKKHIKIYVLCFEVNVKYGAILLNYKQNTQILFEKENLLQNN